MSYSFDELEARKGFEQAVSDFDKLISDRKDRIYGSQKKSPDSSKDNKVEKQLPTDHDLGL